MDSPDAEIYSQSQEKDRNHQKVTDTFYKFHTASHPWYQCFILCISISYFLENIHFVNPLWKSLKSAGAFSKLTHQPAAGNIGKSDPLKHRSIISKNQYSKIVITSSKSTVTTAPK